MFNLLFVNNISTINNLEKLKSVEYYFIDEYEIQMSKNNKKIINFNSLSKNPNAIELLKENQNKIDWFMFSQNPSIFTYDYKKMKEKMKNSGIVEELMAYIFHPRNMEKWKDWGFTEHQEMLELVNE